MFQFPRLPARGLCVQLRADGLSPVGFSHSGTPGSKAVCASPGTIAACRALRRLPVPRHPPPALTIFRVSFFFDTVQVQVAYLRSCNDVSLICRAPLLKGGDAISSLKIDSSKYSLSRYAALRVRRGGPARTGRCDECGGQWERGGSIAGAFAGPDGFSQSSVVFLAR